MKYSNLILLVIFSFFSNCRNESKIVSITDSISVTFPSDHRVTQTDISNKKIEAPYKGDLISIFKVAIDLPDTVSLDLKRLAFVNNINGFIGPFNFRNLDSTFSYNDDLMQSDLKFDFDSHDKQERLFGRFIAKDEDFIAICYQMADTADKKSIGAKDKLFASIKIK